MNRRKEEEAESVDKRREPSLLVGDGEIRGGFGGKMDVGEWKRKDWT